jgi:hypothetical protein
MHGAIADCRFPVTGEKSSIAFDRSCLDRLFQGSCGAFVQAATKLRWRSEAVRGAPANIGQIDLSIDTEQFNPRN